MLRTGRTLFIKWTTEGIVKRIFGFRVFYDARACVSCREYVGILMRVWIPQSKVAPRYKCILPSLTISDYCRGRFFCAIGNSFPLHKSTACIDAQLAERKIAMNGTARAQRISRADSHLYYKTHHYQGIRRKNDNIRRSEKHGSRISGNSYQ